LAVALSDEGCLNVAVLPPDWRLTTIVAGTTGMYSIEMGKTSEPIATFEDPRAPMLAALTLDQALAVAVSILQPS
jgi:hypothetical protein